MSTQTARPAGRPGASLVSVDKVFPAQAIALLNQVAATGRSEQGGIVRPDASQTVAADVRRSEVMWLEPTPTFRPIYDLLGQFVQQANTQAFNLALTGFNEPLQLATYRAEQQGFYGWHVDTGAERLANRKLSLVVPLTDPSEYEGGELQVFYDSEPETVPMPLGRIVAFPSYVLHRVTPLTRGVRRSLAVWVSGPPFR